MKKWLMVLVPVLILGSLVAWKLTVNHREKMKQGEQRASRSGAAASVELASPQYRDIISSYEATGNVESIQNVKISPKVSGNITYLTVREGDHVRQGQVLVRIDQSDVLAAVRQQQASLAEAKFRLAQAQLTQTPTDIAVSTQIRQQEASVTSAEADLTQATQNRASQLQAVKATLDDAQSKIESANAVIANANASINSAQANLENATVKYNRVLGLYKQGYVAAQDVDDAKTTVSVQQAALDTARGQLQSATAAAKSMSAQKRNVEQQGNITASKADADLAAARAKVVQAKASLEYAQANAKQSPAYRQSLEALKAGVAAAQASLDSAQSKVDDTVLRSPLDGVVTGRTQDLGSLASPGQAVLTVQAMKKVWVSIAVPAEVSVKLSLNQPATVAFDALDGRTFTARIAQINPSADLQSRQYTVRVILDNADNL
ncbi:MAG TPA: efflux RND transporter periplasmic adaptor subunit, partial [Armatimonadota bacterium]